MRGLITAKNIYIKNQIPHLDIHAEAICEQGTVTNGQGDCIAIIAGKISVAYPTGNI